MNGAALHPFLLGVVLVVVHLASGCGYTLIDYSRPPDGIRSISIRTFENDSYEPGIDFVVADALRREFLRRDAVSLTEDSEAADVVLSGRIVEIRTSTRSFSSTALALEWEVTLRLEPHASRRDGSEIPFDGNAMEGIERYLESADIEATRKNRDEALRKAAAVLAVRVHDLLYEVYTP